jgi:glycine cleavage system H protein
MANIPKELMYAQTHEWIKKDENGHYIIGITEHAQALLGDIVFVDHKEVGEYVCAGDDVAIAESVKAVSEIFTPISGEVVAFNKRLEEEPELINTDAFGEGWLMVIRPSDVSELNNLLDSAAYQEVIAEEH